MKVEQSKISCSINIGDLCALETAKEAYHESLKEAEFKCARGRYA